MFAFKFKIFRKSKQPLFAVPLGMSEAMSSRNQNHGDNYCCISRSNLVNICSDMFKPIQIYLKYFDSYSCVPFFFRIKGVTKIGLMVL